MYPLGKVWNGKAWVDTNSPDAFTCSSDSFTTFNGIDWDEITQEIDLNKIKKDKPDPRFCCHKWVKYVGLNESFEFCEICDEKRPIRS